MRSFYTLALFLLTFPLFAQEINPEAVSTRLQRQLLEQEGYHDVFILLTDRVDVYTLSQEFNHRNAPIEERVPQLITALKAKAHQTQAELLNFLYTQNGIDKLSIHPYWITNMIFFRAKKEIIAELSFRNEVAWMDLNVALALTDYSENVAETITSPEPNGIEPGLAAINAPAMWALGYTGYGRVAMVNDTGADPSHPSYKLKYRGHYVPGNESWFQFNSGNTTPFDCSGHGSHVLGTMLGLDRNTYDTIGVAFNSQWVGSPGIVCAHRGTESTVGAFQWALDPDGNPSTITDMPDVINNSWHDPDDDNECEGPYVDVLTALEAAGVAVVFSAGNAGPDPQSATPPHNVNVDLVNTFAVGALNANNPDWTIAGFSSRGPSICGGTGSLLIKPEVSAPGVNVRSAELNGTYDLKSGTSMAAPHVSGAILLLKEAFPNLTGSAIKMALYQTCTDLGDPGEDNVYGMGIIDVFAAYNYLIDQGHTPVDPQIEQDLLLVEVLMDDYFCEEEAFASLMVENGGTTAVTSFIVNIEISGPTNISDVFNWTGSLAVGERVNIDLPPLPVAAGNYTYHFSVEQPNGLADERPLNNAYQQKIISIEAFDFAVSVDQLNENLACQGAAALIRAQHEQNATVHWFMSETDEVPVAAGNEFLVDGLDSTTTFYADMMLHARSGLAEPEENLLFDETEGGIVFDSYAPFILKSVTIYPQSTGIAIVSLKTADGMGIGSKTLLINQAGEQEAFLGLNIPKGNDLVLEIDQGIPLGYNSGDIAYPFEVPAVLNIKGSSDSLNAGQSYYYFYDWKIDYDKFCNRLPVTVHVQETTNPPVSGFSVTSNYLDLDISGEIGFTDLSVGATDWFWNFGDGNTSLLSSPSHVYTDTGTFIVSQTIVNAEGCTDTAIDTILVAGTLVGIQDPGISEDLISIFPVPADNYLNIRFDFHKSHDIQIRIYDVAGREVLGLMEKAYYRETKRIELNDLGQGIYFVAFTVEGHSIVKKIIVQRSK